ncbi:class III chitinase [Dichomitus squalens LYAD-421 SS1]|uniref:class III chitinase n=1 Tax=Dichomitus squalens (strain LYAD-421) TaxID=732165 RepID=UPI0004411AA1|nr:class III chitinase [Dichomitus squalens LYAD-421 SS1]EJF66447.1 class III chitinase [Dichomitus squalens LYAD-421 SS1]
MARTMQSYTLGALATVVVGLAGVGVTAYDNSRYDNVVVYWGQDSYGATHTDTANFQKTLSFYCQDDAIDVIPVAFVDSFFGTGGAPVLDLGNTCNAKDNATFSGTGLVNCAPLASDVEFCQSKGKIVTLSLGGGGASVGFQSDSQAETFADTIWNDFLGGTSSTRPFGSAVLDGVDLDIEGGGSTGYVAFINRLRSYFSSASKKYYITGAPQCVYPDANLGAVINSASFDAIYVQFYNNPCGLQVFNSSSGFNFGIWDIWAKTVSPNPDVKVFVGAPASSTAAGSGYQDPATLASDLTLTRHRFPSFGGVMMWDASQAYVNNRYDLAAKNALVAAGGTGFTYPACSAPAYVSGNAYTGNSQVSYNGYIWEAKWWSQNTPSADPNGDWNPISACAGNAPSGTPTSTSAGSAPTAGACAGVAAWNSTTAYNGGQEVTYNGHLWTAKWWTQNETPGSASGVWTDNGACTSSKREALAEPARPLQGSRFFRN